MNAKRPIIIGCVVIGWFLFHDAGRACAQDPRTTGTLYANGFNIVQASFPTQGKVKDFSLKISFDGDTFYGVNAGLPRPWNLFRSISRGPEWSAIIVPVVAGFDVSEPGFFLSEPGKYWFRWSIDFEDEDIADMEIDQVVQVAPATRADLDFIAGLGEPDLARYMFGKDFFERQTGLARERVMDPEIRAVKVIGRLLYATRGRSPDTALSLAGPKGDVDKAADRLFSLAKEIPQSSYAPYAAYYAGCCYASIGLDRATQTVRSVRVPDKPKDRVAEFKHRAALVKKDPDCAKAYEAFHLGAERGDDYLMPKAYRQEAFLTILGGELDEAERLLSKAEELVPAEGTIPEWIENGRKGIEETKRRLRSVADEQADRSNP